MSGKQAKAKRKSAKKAAAVSAPAPDGSRLEEFIIGNVRCFAGEQRVPIRPITLLVGENSTGKTTFLGCYQKFVDMFSIPPVNPPDGEFTRSPFHMGGFLDIVRRDGAGKRKPREFLIGGVANRPTRAASPLSLVYFFRDEHDDATPFKLAVGFPDDDALTIENTGPSPEMGLDTMLTNVSGPDFECLVITPSWMTSHMNYNQTLGSINGQYLHPLPVKGAPRGPATFADIVRSHDLYKKNGDNWKAWTFMKEKFGGKDGGNEFIPLRNAVVNLGECVSIAPIRPMPRRSYGLEVNGSAEERLLFEMSRMSRASHPNPLRWKALRGQLEKFGKQSGMFSGLKVKKDGDANSPFSLQVSIRGVDANIADVGYGVSQLLPFLLQVAKVSAREKSGHFLFQQPEDHLHPSAQAAFASFMAERVNYPADWRRDRGHTFLVETHSDYIIDRVRICVSNGVISPEDVVILYFEPNKKTGAVKIHPIRMDAMANLLDVPAGYRDFFMEEGDRLLGFKKLPKARNHVRHR